MTVDPRYLEIARANQQQLLAAAKKSAPIGAVDPIKLILAEYQYLGLSIVAMHKFATDVGIQITYSSLHEWARRNLGSETGAGSKAGAILEDAAKQGVYSSPYLKPAPPAGAMAPAPALAEAPATATWVTTFPGVHAPTAPAPAAPPAVAPTPTLVKPSTAPAPGRQKDQVRQKQLQALREGMKNFESPFKRLQQRNQEMEQRSEE